MRYAHPRALPIITFKSGMMPTKRGPRPRPEFVISRWLNLEAARPTLAQELNDSIPDGPSDSDREFDDFMRGRPKP
jgi:hypothetical protein